MMVWYGAIVQLMHCYYHTTILIMARCVPVFNTKQTNVRWKRASFYDQVPSRVFVGLYIECPLLYNVAPHGINPWDEEGTKCPRCEAFTALSTHTQGTFSIASYNQTLQQ